MDIFEDCYPVCATPLISRMYFGVEFQFWKLFEFALSRRCLLWASRALAGKCNRMLISTGCEKPFSYLPSCTSTASGTADVYYCVVVFRRLNVKNTCSNFIMLARLNKCCMCLMSCANCSSQYTEVCPCRFIFGYLESQCCICIVKLIFSSCKHPTLSYNKW